MFRRFRTVAFVSCLHLAFAVAHSKSSGCYLYGNSDRLSAYDFIVVGGGTAGLAIANRLSQDSANTVLVLEAGKLDNNENSITIPLLAQMPGGTDIEHGLMRGAIGTEYDWNLTYARQPETLNRSIPMTAGKVVGGSSVLNRMAFDRGSADDYRRWEQLGAEGWGFDDLLPYFKMSETFTPPSSSLVAEWGIEYDPAAHGDHGDVQSSYPPFVFPSLRYFIEAMKELNVSMPGDGANGHALGSFWAPMTVDPLTMRRSDSRTAFLNKAESRQNLHIITGAHVTKLIIDEDKGRVSGVEVSISASLTGIPLLSPRQYSAGPTTPMLSVSVNREVVLSAGAIHTPQILQLSGIGNKTRLAGLGIDAVIDLPGVGANLQDHMKVALANNITIDLQLSSITSNATFAAEQLEIYENDGTGPYSAGTVYFAFLPLRNITTSWRAIFSAAIAQYADLYSSHLPSDTVQAGYLEQHILQTLGLLMPQFVMLEVIENNGVISVILEHPFSRGSVHIQSTDPLQPPIIDAGILTNPLDVQIFVEAFRYARTIANTEAMQALHPIETSPGATTQTDKDIENYVRKTISSVFHAAGTAAMLPRSKGGVVDNRAMVYGMTNLRVMDASTIPMLPGTHLQSTIYAMALKLADMILQMYNCDAST
ncbi:hypothetical protein F5884DRAFT_742955 [Xylogone sp. PMI_703]|nr:hypothetical protein F5884DRAFT_742955 [Xylogone sp. PMI_703]